MAHAVRSRDAPAALRAANQVTFDDGLRRGPRLAERPGHRLARRPGPLLAAALRRSPWSTKPQDTDPIQWQIIRAVFDAPHPSGEHRDGPRLVVIGDPKQSIYSFRGADIESYLAAVDGARTPGGPS